MVIRSVVSVCLSLVLALYVSAGEKPLRIGVFDQHATGGQGADVDALIQGLNKMGYQAESITGLNVLVLAPYDVVFFADMYSPGNVTADWREEVKQFIRAGGSILQMWHHHQLPEIGVGVQRIRAKRRMHVVTGHPAIEGVQDFEASFSDHIIERVGPAGTPLLKNDEGQTVACAGKLGSGKVISTGLALGMPNGRTAIQPRGAERKLLEAFLRWLAPEIPVETRVSRLLSSPKLVVSPSESFVAAGFPGTFRVAVGCPKGEEIQIDCPSAEVTDRQSTETRSRGLPVVRTFTLSAKTIAGENADLRFPLRVAVGTERLHTSLRVRAVYCKPPSHELRGVWLHVRKDRHPKDVMPELKRLGINMAVLRIAGGTAAFYASKVQPDIQDPLAPDGDWLAEAVKYAHANGIAIHPYVNNCIVEGRTSKKTLARLRAAGRLQEDPNGRPIDWFCPSQDVNFEAMERPMVEIATRYKVDGIQYDFIRYPDSSGCFCAKCRQRFEQETERPVAHWPGDCIGGPRHKEWVEFRCGRISALVRRISTRIREVAPDVKISAAVFRGWPNCRESNGQDWVRWCREGWLDFVCPMNYTLDAKIFAKRTQVHRCALPSGFPLVEGIGIASAAGRMQRPEELAVQIMLARREGASGFVGFAYVPKHTSVLFTPLIDWMDAEPISH